MSLKSEYIFWKSIIYIYTYLYKYEYMMYNQTYVRICMYEISMYISSDPALRGARQSLLQEKLRLRWVWPSRDAFTVCVAPRAVCQYIPSCARICCPSTNMFLLYIHILYTAYICLFTEMYPICAFIPKNE